MNESTWVITTFTFLGTTVLSWLVTASFWLLMKPEGRFFFLRVFDGKGIDVVRHEPLSNRLRLITVKWNGQFFSYGKEMILFGVEALLNPKTDAQKYYNQVISRMCTWAGSKRPVLFATDIMSHMITPDLAALAAKSRKNEKYEKAREKVLRIFNREPYKDETANVDYLENTVEPIEPANPQVDTGGITVVSYLETVKPDDLQEFMEDISARDMWQVYQKGKRVNELEKKRLLDISPTTIAISIAGIGLVLLLIYMVSSGRLQAVVESLRP
jgi:hypothetical protein